MNAGAAASSSSGSPERTANKVDPFCIEDPADFAAWLKGQLPVVFHEDVETLRQQKFEGDGFKRASMNSLVSLYKLAPGAADKLIAVRDRLLGGTEAKDQGVPYRLWRKEETGLSDIQTVEVSQGSSVGFFKAEVMRQEKIDAPASQVHVYKLEEWQQKQKQQTISGAGAAAGLEEKSLPSALKAVDSVPRDVSATQYLVVVAQEDDEENVGSKRRRHSGGDGSGDEPAKNNRRLSGDGQASPVFIMHTSPVESTQTSATTPRSKAARQYYDDFTFSSDWKDASFGGASGGFVMNHVLGSGVHSRVYSARVLGVSVAVKVYHREDDFERERSFLRQFIGQPHLPQMMHQGYIFSLHGHKPALAMPLCATVPSSRVMRDGKDWVVACRHLKSALASLRRLGITHNDIKPDNVLVSVDSGKIVLNDFSHACMAGEETLYADHRFVKPDCRDRRCSSSYAADVYSAARVAREWAVAVVDTRVNLPLDMIGLQRWFSADITVQ